MDAYNEIGTFPTNLPSSECKYFKGPIRMHYRPRSFIPVICYSAWTYFTIPFVINVLNSVFGTGLMGISAGLLILGISKLFQINMFEIVTFIFIVTLL